MKTIGKSQFVIDPKKKSQTLKKNQTNNPWYIHTCVWRKNLRESFFLWVMMMMDKGTNLSMDGEPTICETTMSLHLRELEDFCLCDHFDPNLLLQHRPSSLQSLCVVVSTTTTKKHKIPKIPKNTTPLNKTNPQTPNKRNFTHTQQHNPQTPNKSNCTNTHVNNPKTTQQEKFHKHSTRDLKLNQHKVQIHKTPNKKKNSANHPTPNNNKRKSTNHPTPNKERIHNYPTRDLKLEILITNIKNPKSLETRHELSDHL